MLTCIGIAGKRGSGKNEVAKMLQLIAKRRSPSYSPGFESKIPDPFIELAFADPLKEITATITGRSLESFYTQEGKSTFMPEFNMTQGEALQKIGDGMRNEFCSEVWAQATIAKVHPGHKHLITDVRKFNEVLAIHSKSGIVLRIEGNPTGCQGDGTRDDNHDSETALDDYPFGYIIHNDGTLDQLFQKVLTFANDVIFNDNRPVRRIL